MLYATSFGVIRASNRELQQLLYHVFKATLIIVFLGKERVQVLLNQIPLSLNKHLGRHEFNNVIHKTHSYCL